MGKKLPTIVDSLLKNYIKQLDKVLPGRVEGIYLYGSVALNAFDDSSDIDYITVVNHYLTKEEVHSLSLIHREIEKNYPKPMMQGGYLLWSDIGKKEEEITPYPYYTDGVMYSSGFSSHNPVTWWTLKNYGVRILGPSINELNVKVSERELIEYVHQNMNAYWKNRITNIEHLIDTNEHLDKFTETEIDWEIEWSVLGVLRQFYTISELDITSKIGAGIYALDVIPKQWHRIIHEALSIRKGLEDRYYGSNQERITEAIAFIKYLINHSNHIVNSSRI
ncbi:hypothetical protein WQ54_28790 [Bacillus sp. SA1-12]|uniref:aminoglycoside adenylyltransferase domain-containing protein n=1 Tax=Bacillus sp. SA1-12 TaxID=1455638 RepID=UPI0006272900|nr:aminoglycoside adenylyltransferase domain-containing protein [Bacillus sp. SA1-12]KKI88921.1 hypothetical protein WQ54_28790 [Bacillus sp. SA1-12]